MLTNRDNVLIPALESVSVLSSINLCRSCAQIRCHTIGHKINGFTPNFMRATDINIRIQEFEHHTILTLNGIRGITGNRG